MILGVGNDIHDVRHVERYPERYLHHFTAAERQACEKRSERWQAYTSRFCIKEAVMKALGSNDVLGGVELIEIEVINTVSGRPTVTLRGGAARQLDAITPAGTTAVVAVTASDFFPFAIAYCTIWAG